MAKKSPSQMTKEKQIAALNRSCNSLISDFRFGTVQTWKHVADTLGLGVDGIQELFGDRYPVADLSARIKFSLLEDFIKVYYDWRKEIINYGAKPSLGLPCPIFKLDRTLARLQDYWNRPVVVMQKPEEESDDYADELPPPKGGTFKLRGFQNRAAAAIWQRWFVEKRPSVLLEAPVGVGKTFVLGRLLRGLEDIGYASKYSVSPWPYIYVTKAPIVEQTRRVLANIFGLDCVSRVHVINIEQLRASLGEIFVEEKTEIVNGEPVIVYKWRPFINPIVVAWDECQGLKNEGAQQTEIAVAFQELLATNPNIKQVFSSATPFMCVSEARCFTLATRLPAFKFAGSEFPIDKKSWYSWSRSVAAPAHPSQFVPAAMERYMNEVKPYVVSIKGVRAQFKARNSVKLIGFQTQWQSDFYQAAWARYLEKMAKINRDAPGGPFLELVIRQQFQIAAEYAKYPQFSEDAYTLTKQGFAAVIAVGFKPVIAKSVATLVNEYGISRDKISIIWGGDGSLNQKIMTDEEADKLLTRIRETKDVTKTELKHLENWLKYKNSAPEDREEEEKLKKIYRDLELGPQSKKQRQIEIDRFQSGKSLICFFTFKSGGVGLSLHHTDEMTKEKCRYKPNGWAYPEDIPLIPTRPRVSRISTTYSAVEMAQGVGRAPRLTSLSNTEQAIVGFEGTVEVGVLQRCSQKLKCLKKVVQNRESWEGAIYESKGYSPSQYKEIEQQIDTSVVETDEQISTDDEDEEE